MDIASSTKGVIFPECTVPGIWERKNFVTNMITQFYQPHTVKKVMLLQYDELDLPIMHCMYILANIIKAPIVGMPHMKILPSDNIKSFKRHLLIMKNNIKQRLNFFQKISNWKLHCIVMPSLTKQQKLEPVPSHMRKNKPTTTDRGRAPADSWRHVQLQEGAGARGPDPGARKMNDGP